MQYGQIESLTEHFQNTSSLLNTAFFTCIYIKTKTMSLQSVGYSAYDMFPLYTFVSVQAQKELDTDINNVIVSYQAILALSTEPLKREDSPQMVSNSDFQVFV